ncbi:hypothetical protein QTI17_31420 [Variovorax sp. J31P179]|nr:hypothetical protein [Variovorax sp. J31P179]MDM0085106.1 hypothetical protein [Variovorax sp. J31P179]
MPVSPSLTLLKEKALPEELADDPDGLHRSSNDFFGVERWRVSCGCS